MNHCDAHLADLSVMIRRAAIAARQSRVGIQAPPRMCLKVFNLIHPLAKELHGLMDDTASWTRQPLDQCQGQWTHRVMMFHFLMHYGYTPRQPFLPSLRLH